MRLTLTLAAAAAALATGLPALAQTAQSSTTQSTPPENAAPASSAATSASATAPASTTLTVGQPVKDKTGVVIGSITELKPGAAGQTATVKMGEQTFAIGAESFVVQNGAAVINATQAELKAMIANAAKPG